MNALINDGGPAFGSPTVGLNGILVYHNGISVCDWFAGQALAGALQNYTTSKYGCTETQVAIGAYRYADAMLAARNAQGGQIL